MKKKKRCRSIKKKKNGNDVDIYSDAFLVVLPFDKEVLLKSAKKTLRLSGLLPRLAGHEAVDYCAICRGHDAHEVVESRVRAH